MNLSFSVYGQYLANPSFEGTPQQDIPPPEWTICPTIGNTPDVLPGVWGVVLPASDGSTFLGMTSREDFTWEDVHSTLVTPLSKDSCYRIKVDLAFQIVVSGMLMHPSILKVYGSNSACDKGNLLWESLQVSNYSWATFEFMLTPGENDITDCLVLK